MKRFALPRVLALCSCTVRPNRLSPLYGSQQMGPVDSVNLQSLNINVSIPLVSAPGRGINFKDAVTYNTMNWSPLTGTWAPVSPGNISNWGWMAAYPYGTVTSQWSDSEGNCGRCIVGDGCQGYTDTQVLSGYTYVDSAGTPHYFSVYVEIIYNSCSNSTSYSGTYTGYSADGLYYINLHGNSGNPPTSTWIYDVSNGTKIDLTGYAVVTDRNGNQITASSDGTGGTKWTDTTGRVAEDVAFTGTHPTSYKYTDPNNSPQAFTLKWQNYSIMTNFGCSGISEYNSTGTMPQVSLPYELDLPNGQKYSFTYEGTPSHTGFYTGRIATITLPTGGIYTYTYGATNDGINCADATIDNVSRTISGPGITTAVWAYQRTGSIPTGYTTTVTAPLMPWDTAANQYVYTFNSLGQQREEQDYQGSATSGTAIKTVVTTWATNGSPSTQVTSLPTTPATESEVATTYDANGHLQQLQEYDWGSGTIGSLIRITNLTYTTISAPFPFEVLTEKTLLNSGSIVSWREDLGYDGSTPSCVTGVSQHDYTNFGCSFNARGNLTSVTTYTSPAVPSVVIVRYLRMTYLETI